MLAAIRPSDWNFPLYVHIGGALMVVASLVVASFAIFTARQRGDQPVTRFSARVLTLVTFPSYIVMRVGAEIMLSKEHLKDSKDTWLGIGYGVSDIGMLLLLVGMVLTGLMARKAGRGESVAHAVPLRIAGAITGLLLVAFFVAIWAMTTKPGS